VRLTLQLGRLGCKSSIDQSSKQRPRKVATKPHLIPISCPVSRAPWSLDRGDRDGLFLDSMHLSTFNVRIRWNKFQVKNGLKPFCVCACRGAKRRPDSTQVPKLNVPEPSHVNAPTSTLLLATGRSRHAVRTLGSVHSQLNAGVGGCAMAKAGSESLSN